MAETNEVVGVNEEQVRSIVDEIKSILSERMWNVRIELIMCKWEIGDTIVKNKLEGKEVIISRLAGEVGMNPREMYRCIQFREKYPKLMNENGEVVIEELPEGKNVSWFTIKNKYLPETGARAHECVWNDFLLEKCSVCGKVRKKEEQR